MVLQASMNMAASRSYQSTIKPLDLQSVEDGVIYQNASVNTIFLGLLNTQYNRARFPSANFTEWLPLDTVATLLKMWSTGGNRPECGAYVGFKMEGKKKKLVFPEYY